MLRSFGISVYASTFLQQKNILEHHQYDGVPVFISLQIPEEMNDTYVEKMKMICNWLYEKNFYVIADVSNQTIHYFHVESFIALKELLHLHALRLDCGFNANEIIDIAKQIPIVMNASTINYELAKSIVELGGEVYAMHNFYPRSETGLDCEYFKEITDHLHEYGIKVCAFIPGDLLKRGPIKEGLPTLEKHRFINPYVAYMELKIRYKIDLVFVGDALLKPKTYNQIMRYETSKIIELPCKLEKSYQHLYGQIFTNRVDSPKWIIRVEESRSYRKELNTEIKPMKCNKPRKRGSITIDNDRYLRYAGEIQILVHDLKEDERVNQIGAILDEYLFLIDCIQRKNKFMLMEP